MTILMMSQYWDNGKFLTVFLPITEGDVYRDGYATDEALPVIPTVGDWVQAMYPNPYSGGIDSPIQAALRPLGLKLGEQQSGYTREIIPL